MKLPSINFIKKQKSAPAWHRMHHFIFIEAPINVVAPVALFWGDALWWPKKCKLAYVMKSKTEGYLGSLLRIKVLKILGMSWLAEVTRYKADCLVEHAFKKGMFSGTETITLEERYNGTRLDYELAYFIRGPLNKILWPFRFQKEHVACINAVLNAIQECALRTYREQQEKESKRA